MLATAAPKRKIPMKTEFAKTRALEGVTKTSRAAWLPAFAPSAPRVSRAKPMNNLQLVDSLCQVSAALRETRRTHVRSFGTLIPHVFMGDVLARVGACLLTETRKASVVLDCEIAGILESLERGMAAGDRETRNVISISFIGDGKLEPFFGLLKPLLGPKVRAQLHG
jgi:hypothetical protein